MGPITIIILAVSLGMDAFAVAATAGLILDRLSFRRMFRLSFHFGFFQFIMPILGWLAGRTVAGYITAYSHWVAFGLLGFIGGKMLYESFQIKSLEDRSDPTKGWTLIFLSVATSIDALAVGLTMAMLHVSVLLPSIVIGLTASAMTIAGMLIGRKLGRHLGSKLEILAGLVLIAIGAKILIQHLTA